MPLHMILPKPAKIQPRLAIGQPFQPAGAPVNAGHIPESATLVGDQTGKAYVRVGDNPNGNETMQITPPRAAPVSMANGGVVTIGNKVVRTPGENEDPLVNQANFLSSMDASKYGQLGVAAPPRPAFQSSADEAINNMKFAQATQDVYQKGIDEREQASEKAIRDADRVVARQDRATAKQERAADKAEKAAEDAIEAPVKAKRLRDALADAAGQVEYVDPFTNESKYTTRADKAIRQYRDNEKLKEMESGVPAGYEKYEDPWHPGKFSVMTKADAAIQSAKDSARISSAASGQYIDPETGAVTQLTPGQAAIARAQEAKRRNQAVSGVPEGMVEHEDIYTGKKSIMTPHDAALQKLKDNAAIKKEYEATLGPLGQLSEPQIIKELANLKASAGAESAAKIQFFRDELAKRGWFPDAIDIAVGQSSGGGGINLGPIPGSNK